MLNSRSSLADVALVVGDALRRHGIRAVLTGGACAHLYTAGTYTSLDADFVVVGEATRDALDAAMASVGFTREGDRYTHPALPYWIEFPRGPLAIGRDDAVVPVARGAGRRRMLALSATDSCRDRLAAWYHWNDRQAFETAVQIAIRNRIRWSVLARWSRAEGFRERGEEFRRTVRAARAREARRGRDA